MKIKHLLSIIFVLALFAGSINVDAASPNNAIPPAQLPWSIKYVDNTSLSDVDHVSIAHHPSTGRAYISYYDAKDFSLWVAQETDRGTGNCYNKDWICTKVDSTGDVGLYSSIDVTTYRPIPFGAFYTLIGVSYYDLDNRSLKYAEFDQYLNPLNQWTISTVDQSEFILTESRGLYTSMKFNLDKDPVIGYHARQIASAVTDPYGAVKIAKYVKTGGTGCNGASHPGAWSCVLIDSNTTVATGSHVSIDHTYEGILQIAFYDAYDGSLVFARLSSTGYGSCTNTDYNCTTIDDGGSRGQYVSLHSPKSATDKIRFAYYDPGDGKLRYAEYIGVASGYNCASPYFGCQVVGFVGGTPSYFALDMTVDNQGYPIIAYMDASDDMWPARLEIARPAAAYGQIVGNCGEPPPGYLAPVWTCKVLDADQYSHKAGSVGVSVSRAGLATVAYSEDSDYYNRTTLKVAQQHFMTYLPLIKK